MNISSIWNIIPISVASAIIAALLTWLREMHGRRLQYTFSLYQHFFSDSFAQTRSRARQFKSLYQNHSHITAHYFIYLDVDISGKSEKKDYYDTITDFASILYFFSSLVEHLQAGTINQKSTIRLFKHVFEWWYISMIRDFIASYEKEFELSLVSNRPDKLSLKSTPPWVDTIKKLAVIMGVE